VRVEHEEYRVSPLKRLKEQKQAVIIRYARSDDRKGLVQVLSGLAGLALLWWAIAWSSTVSRWLAEAGIVLMTLFLSRLFVLMHDCCHGCLFRSQTFNRACGFLLGVIVGLPQYVWSKRHAFHHATNGNSEKFRGVLNTLTVEEYASLSKAQQRRYRWLRHVAFAPYGGFMYMLFRPRFAWLKGTLDLVLHCLKQKLKQPKVSIRIHAAGFQTKYWRTAVDYRHMCWNNIASFVLWACMCFAVGPVLFFTVYFASISLVGGILILLVHSQHNFEHAYAARTADWDGDAATLYGTSFMLLPGWLNWFTANTAYHHVHHLSAAIPNYLLVECHNTYQHLFTDVVRLRLADIPRTLKCVLWDTRGQRIISIAEFEQHCAKPVNLPLWRTTTQN
jgi:acyl-lipid omega-6 desaturase (Delta-12 desaturase)